MSMTFETILLEVDETDRVATITLNRPAQLNAFNRTMCEERPAPGAWSNSTTR